MLKQQCRSALVLALLCITHLTSCASSSKHSEIALNSSSPDLTDQKISALIKKGDDALARRAYDDAQVQYALAIKAQPSDIDLLYKLAVVHYEKQSFDVASELLRSILTTSGDHIGAFEMLGLIALKQENLAIAENNLNKALSLDATRWRSQNAMGVVKDMQSLHAEAQQHFLQALHNSPNKAQAENNLGYSYYLDGSYRLAERHFRNATRINPRYEKAWSNLGLVYIKTKQYEDARYAFAKIVDDHVASNNLGYLGMLQGDNELAEQELSRAVLIAPTYYPKASENLASLDSRTNLRYNRNAAQKGEKSVLRGDVQNPVTGNAVVSAVPTVTVSDNSIKHASEEPTLEQLEKAVVVNEEPGVRSERPRVIIKQSASRSSGAHSEAKPARSALKTGATKSDAKVVKRLAEKKSSNLLNKFYLQVLGYPVGENSASLHSPLLSFQAQHQLEPSGKLDSQSAVLLKAQAIERVKTLLVSLNYGVNLDISGLDSSSVLALKKFQANNALRASGKLDMETLVLLAGYLSGDMPVSNEL